MSLHLPDTMRTKKLTHCRSCATICPLIRKENTWIKQNKHQGTMKPKSKRWKATINIKKQAFTINCRAYSTARVIAKRKKIEEYQCDSWLRLPPLSLRYHPQCRRLPKHRCLASPETFHTASSAADLQCTARSALICTMPLVVSASICTVLMVHSACTSLLLRLTAPPAICTWRRKPCWRGWRSQSGWILNKEKKSHF